MRSFKPGLFILPLVVWFSTGCQSGPAPTRYLLEPASVDDARSAPLALESLGLATVSVPGYVKDSSIVSRTDGARLILDDSAQWAEAPDTAMTRVLAESLRLRGGTDVLIEPLPRGFDPGARVEVGFDQLLGNRTGGVDLSGQIRLISGDGRRLLEVLPFQLSHRADHGEGSGKDGYFDALALALDDLARLIVARLDRAPA